MPRISAALNWTVLFIVPRKQVAEERRKTTMTLEKYGEEYFYFAQSHWLCQVSLCYTQLPLLIHVHVMCVCVCVCLCLCLYLCVSVCVCEFYF